MVDYHTPRFKSSAVADAAGISPATFRSYFARKQFRVMGDNARLDALLADKAGIPNLFSLRDALGLAVALKLVSFGVDPKVAWDAAMLKFAHTGDEDRAPAALFDVRQKGETLLIFWPQSKEAALISDGDFSGAFDLRLCADHPDPKEAALILVLNPLVARVLDALNVTAPRP